MRRVGDVPRIARLRPDAHKGDRGRVLLVAGSIGMSGAARLAGWGALRGGAGIVKVACPDVVQIVVAGDLPCALTLPLPSRRGALAPRGAAAAREVAADFDAIGVGPGLTLDAAPFLRLFLQGMRKPLVLDADALNAIAADRTILDGVQGPRVITPHPGEAARLLGHAVGADRESRLQAAEELAARYRCVAVLKGAGTIVCDGEQTFVNRTGNVGMATGGAGDVLTGLIAARLAGGADPFSAAVQAVHAHGRAGDLATASLGEGSVIATDLVANLPIALDELKESLPRRTRGRSGGAGERGSRRRR